MRYPQNGRGHIAKLPVHRSTSLVPIVTTSTVLPLCSAHSDVSRISLHCPVM